MAARDPNQVEKSGVVFYCVKGKKRMHAVVIQSLEEYLSGTLEPAARREIEAHLNICGPCREEVHSMQEVSQMFLALRSEEELSVPAAFFAGVMRRVEAQEPQPSWWNLFTVDLVFARRLAFASLLTLAVLGSYLISREANYDKRFSPEAVMAQQESPFFDRGPAQENMLVTLTAYEH
jgi:anti-sigma factor RsiW